MLIECGAIEINILYFRQQRDDRPFYYHLETFHLSWLDDFRNNGTNIYKLRHLKIIIIAENTESKHPKQDEKQYWTVAHYCISHQNFSIVMLLFCLSFVANFITHTNTGFLEVR